MRTTVFRLRLCLLVAGMALWGQTLKANEGDVKVDGLYYSLQDEWSLSKEWDEVMYDVAWVVSPENKEEYSGNIVIPETISANGKQYKVVKIDEGAFKNSPLTSITISDNVLDIYYDAFEDCVGLNEVILSKNLKIIRSGAFWGCSSLKSIIIPASVLQIQDAFQGCSSLDSVVIEDCSTPIEVMYIEDYESKQTHTRGGSAIGYRGIFNDGSLKDAYIGRNVILQDDYYHNNQFHDYAPLMGIKTLSSVTYGPQVTAIEKNALNGCTGLTSVSLPANLATIGEGAFKGTGLQRISLPATVNSIGAEAFADCLNMTEVTSFINIPFNLDESAFILNGNYSRDLMYQVIKLRVPQGRKMFYAATEGWMKFTNIEEFDASGIGGISTGSDATIQYRYGLDGLKTQLGGLNIIRYSDGSTKKEICY